MDLDFILDRSSPEMCQENSLKLPFIFLSFLRMKCLDKNIFFGEVHKEVFFFSNGFIW